MLYYKKKVAFPPSHAEREARSAKMVSLYIESAYNVWSLFTAYDHQPGRMIIYHFST